MIKCYKRLILKKLNIVKTGFMTSKLFRFIIYLAVFTFSCQLNYPDKFSHPLRLLEGEWAEAPGIGYSEVWKRGDRGLEGAGFVYAGNSMVQTESISITITDLTLIYNALVETQNNGKIISFLLEHYSDTSLIFANPQHDFPNIIAYTFLSDSLLHISVESLWDSTRNFGFKLKKTGN